MDSGQKIPLGDDTNPAIACRNTWPPHRVSHDFSDPALATLLSPSSLPANPAAQFANVPLAPWKTSPPTSHAISGFSESFLRQGHSLASGLPSPAPTGPITSPLPWGRSGLWAAGSSACHDRPPPSPLSPSTGSAAMISGPSPYQAAPPGAPFFSDSLVALPTLDAIPGHLTTGGVGFHQPVDLCPSDLGHQAVYQQGHPSEGLWESSTLSSHDRQAIGAQGHVMGLTEEQRISVPESAVSTGPSCLPSRRSTKRPSVSDQGQNGEEHGLAKKARGPQVTPETTIRTNALSIKTQPGAETSEDVVITKLKDGAHSTATLDCGQEATYTNDALTASLKPPLSHVKQKNESKEQNHPPPTATRLKPVLRTATRRRSQNQPPASSLPKPGETPARQRARTNHNRVEQQYRHRLQARFESLCRVLPLTDAEHDEAADDDNSVAEDEDEDDPEDVADVAREPRKRRGHGQKDNHNQQQRRMSKEAVLLLAEQTIQELQHKVERLEKEKEVLLKTMGQICDPGSALSAG